MVADGTDGAVIVDETDEVHQTLLPKQVSKAEPVSSLLEEVLSDYSLSFFQRIQKVTCVELKLLFRLACPAIFVYLLNNITSITTQILCSHLENLTYAAAALGNNDIQIFAYGVMVEKSWQRLDKWKDGKDSDEEESRTINREFIDDR